MTLQEWSEKHGESVFPFTPGQPGPMCVHDRTRSSEASWDLYHLTDYLVSSVRAGTVWLVTRP